MTKLRPALTYILIFIFCCTSCGLLDKSYHEKIIGNYEIEWVDLEGNQNISKAIDGCSGCYSVIIDNYVYAVGHNQDFIIAKQHAGTDKNITHYYIINLTQNKDKYRDGVTGPVMKEVFDSLRRRLNISDIPFNKTYTENP